MIVTFHYFANFLYDLIKKFINERNSGNNFAITQLGSHLHPIAQRNEENQIKFDPPVFRQRYERVTEILVNEKWKNQLSKLVDFGSAEFGFFIFIKNTVPVKEFFFVDVDEYVIQEYMYRLYPLNADYYLARRTQKLTVKAFVGNAASPDLNLINTDVITALELIEHLYPDTLEALPYNIFSYIRPKLAIFTTPNSEFNILFDKQHKFRHADHKFEWTRDQFESWARNLTVRFPNYTVQFDGVGLGPEGTDELGCCSQLAVFIRKDIICDNYVEEDIICSCTESTCKSLECRSLIKCFCNCLQCLPKSSFGVCTYNSLSKLQDQDDKYKLIYSVDYPYTVDTRTEEEKTMDELKYRLHLLGDVNGVYFNHEKNRSEIPISRLAYQTTKAFPAESELRTLLQKFHYKIEKCLNQETEQLETCVIYEPEMDTSGSGSDTEASGYESDKRTADDSPLSDWDDKDVVSQWNCPQTTKDSAVVVKGESPKRQMRLEVNTTKKQQGPLFDSGYQKSPSVADDSPQSLNDVKITPNEKPNRLSHILSVFDNFDKINELDAVRKEKKFFNFSSNLPHREVMKKICQEIVKHPIAGPSRDSKKKQPKKSQSSDSDESVEDVKSITTCILENSLNKIDFNGEEIQAGALIQELIPQAMPELPPPLEEVVEPALIVENGDLANNNRDLEGNNYPAEEREEVPQPENDNAIDNLEVNNINIDNNNEIVEPAPQPVEPEIVEEVADNNIEIEPPVDVEVAWSSREALFDVNSHVDLLDDFEMDATVVNGIALPSNYVIVSDSATAPSESPVLPPEETGFPNWLLQIFEEGEAVPPEDDMHDEPHFYCQGDGLGVHPSTVALNDDDEDDDDDEGNESGSDSSSRSGSVDFASAENANSNLELETPDESRTDDSIVVLGQSLSLSASNQNSSVASSENEVFQSAEESESNLMTNSCTQ